MGLEQDIKHKGFDLGFDAVGITDASPIAHEHVEHFQTWLRSGYAGRMAYMHRNLEKRIDPAQLVKGARTVIVVALNYKPLAAATAVRWATPTISQASSKPIGRVATYAQYQDYHDFIKPLLRELAGFVQVLTGRRHRFEVCVDSAPLAERALAVRAGLGFIGMNHLLIHPQLGPQILLGELITTLDLHADEPSTATCGDCDLCLKACPTGALHRGGLLDARECISYMTQYEPAQRIGDWLFGCDECLLACPHQRRAPGRMNRQFTRRVEWAQVDVEELLRLTPGAFAERFHNSPMTRAGLETLRANARMCRENCRYGATKISPSLEGNSQP